MDQDNTKGPEKRNWREKLGIGTNGAVGAPPKISDDFKKAAPPAAPMSRATPRPDPAAKPAVKPAPMAPRPGSMPIAKAAPPRPAAPVAPDKLAERLRTQRDASAKLAEQRVQVARQRVEAPPAPVQAPATVAPTSAAPKPKFSFAEDDASRAASAPKAAPGVAVRPAPAAQPAPTPPPQVKPAVFQPQQMQQPALAPSRPSLGAGAPPFTQRPQNPNIPPSANPSYQPGMASSQPYQQPPMPGGYVPQNYGQQPQQPMPGYRPIDPATGYPQQPYGQIPGQIPGQPQYQPGSRPSFAPQQRMAPQPNQAYVPSGSGPRLNVPQRPGMNPNYQGGDAAAPGSYVPAGSMRVPPRVARAPESYDDNASDDGMFDDPPPNMQRGTGRRPTSVDYQQAYRDAEARYEEELPRSRLPWILPGILLVALMLTGAGVWAWQTYKKPLMNDGNQQATTQPEVPVVPAPAQPPKAQPEQTQQDATAGGATRKQIYDRIVGDKEVIGGQLVPTEEAPMQPDANAVPQPTDGAAPAQGGDAVPLPIPPPPGDNTQGALEPATPPITPDDPNKQSAEILPTAAGESQAAVAVPAPGESTALAQATAPSTPPDLPLPPAVTETATAEQSTNTASADATDVITDTATADTEKLVTSKPKLAVKKKPSPAAKTDSGAANKKLANLGSKPVVLVPPSKKARQASGIASDETQVAAAPSENAGNGGLYGGDYVVDSPAAAASSPAQVKKKRTLADLFQGNANQETATTQPAVPSAQPEPAIAQKPVAIKPLKPVPAPVKVASLNPPAAAGGYVAQLASFRSNAEATAEFARLRSKHSGALGGLSPVISQASVAGSTRYRLGVGPFASRDAANALCSKLFAAGERDCLVRN